MSRKSKTPIQKKKTIRESTSPQRVFFFKVFSILLPIFLVLLLEGLLRLAGYGDNLKLFIQVPVEEYENYMIVNPEIGKKYFQKMEYTSPAKDIFPKKKPANTVRVFVMGSSVVYGFPYDRNLMFSRILEQQLRDTYPDKNFEVVNTSITAINSFTLRDYIGQILKYSPDAVLIYEGHNEFYGAFGIGSNETMSRNSFLVRMHLAMMDFRSYQLLRNMITGISSALFQNKAERTQGTLMKRIVADSDILYQSREYNITMKRYRQNMGYILQKAGKKNVPVFLSEMVSNVSGMEPFNSIGTDNLEAALDVYNQARKAEQNQDYENALQLYYKAKDLDCLRFRASEDINVIIRELTDKHNGFLVPMLSHFQTHSTNKLIGTNYMTEHVHPNIAGSFLMADAFFNAITNSGIFGESDQMPRSIDYYKTNWGYTNLDSLIAHHRIQLLMRHWPFVLEADEETDYIRMYKPNSYLDSLAVSVIKYSNISLTDVRLSLARKYEKEGQIHLAYKEYESLLRMDPNVAVNYRDAASCLLQLGDLPKALDYMLTSLRYENSFFAKFRIGEIYLFKGDYNNAIRYLEEAMDLAPADRRVNVMGKLYMALMYNGNTDRANAFAIELQRLKANHFLRIPAKRYTFNDYIPYQTEPQVSQARLLMEENKNEEALDILKSSLSIYDSHIANRMIGELYMKQNDIANASIYLDKVYEQFKFDSRFLHNYIMMNISLNDMDRARESFQEMKRIHPDYAQLRLLSMILG